MSSDFASIIEEVKNMSSEDKEELRFLLEKYLIEERREEIYKNYSNSLQELKCGKLEFTNDINKLKEMVRE